MTFGSSPSSSQYYAYWVGVGKAINAIYPQLQIVISETQGAVDSTKRCRTGDVIIGICTSSTACDTYNGTGSFKDDPDPTARVLWYFDKSYIQMVVAKSAGITGISDLNGKKFNPGGTGTSAAQSELRILDILGVKPDLFESSQNDAGDAVTNRQIIGATKLGIVPDSFVMQIAAGIDIDIVSLTDEEVAKVCAECPDLAPATIQSGSYKGVDHEIKTVMSLQGCQTTTDQVDQELGYMLVKAMCEDGRTIWGEAYPSGANIDILELSLSSTVPLHAGTVQYMVEKGYTVPENLIPPEYVPVA
jgi:TRAP transporter TAXI family solute receptor